MPFQKSGPRNIVRFVRQVAGIGQSEAMILILYQEEIISEVCYERFQTVVGEGR